MPVPEGTGCALYQVTEAEDIGSRTKDSQQALSLLQTCQSRPFSPVKNASLESCH